MLPLLPALILLIFRGPVDHRLAIDDCRLSSGRVEAVSSNRSGAALLALAKNPAFSRTVVELLRYLPADRADFSASEVCLAAAPATFCIAQPVLAQECDGFFTAQRNRDGPIL